MIRDEKTHVHTTYSLCMCGGMEVHTLFERTKKWIKTDITRERNWISGG